MRGWGGQADFQVVKLCAVLAGTPWRRVHLTQKELSRTRHLSTFEPCKRTNTYLHGHKTALLVRIKSKLSTVYPTHRKCPYSLPPTGRRFLLNTLKTLFTLSRVVLGRFPRSELTGQDIPFVMRILLLIKAIQPDQSNAKQYARRKSFFIKNSWKRSISFSK